MKSTFLENDVTVLLKDISGSISATSLDEREYIIQHGGYYSEMLPVEYEPSPEYMKLYELSLANFSGATAYAVRVVAEKIYAVHGMDAVLVSLARAGTPAGVLIKRYFKIKYKADIPHYTISIIKGRGIDKNAMRYILSRHNACDIQFIDGWTGKGSILRELQNAVIDFPGVGANLAVLADPGRITQDYGTDDDFLIPSSCLNSTVTGLLSRTVLNKQYIGEHDFHGAVFYEKLKPFDRTYEFIDTITGLFPAECGPYDGGKIAQTEDAGQIIKKIQKDFSVPDIEYIKPGIGETTRVLLRRVPYKILVNGTNDTLHLGHIYELAREKGVEVLPYKTGPYRACGIIKSIGEL